MGFDKKSESQKTVQLRCIMDNRAHRVPVPAILSMIQCTMQPTLGTTCMVSKFESIKEKNLLFFAQAVICFDCSVYQKTTDEF